MDHVPAAKTFAFEDAEQLTKALKRGDGAAFAWLYDQWSHRISRYCFALAAGDAALAADIAQAVWLRMVRHIRVVRDEAALWNWIACAARHAAADLRRATGRYRRVLDRFMEWRHQPFRSVAENRTDGLLTALEQALLQLAPEERELIHGRYFAGESLATIAVRHALSERAVEGRLARLRLRLRELIAKHLQSMKS